MRQFELRLAHAHQATIRGEALTRYGV